MFLGLFERSSASIEVIVACRNTSGVPTAPDGDVTLTSWKTGGADTTTTATPLVGSMGTGLHRKTIVCSSLDASTRTIIATYQVGGVNRVQEFRFQMY